MIPKVSVITIVFNGEKYIENTIKSVLGQNYTNLEYIIIDGGSSDSTINIVNKYKDNIDIIVSEPDDGLADAMNKGVKYATGDWILHLHSDDVFYENNSISNLIYSIDVNNAYWVTGYLNYQDKNGVIFKNDIFYSFSFKRMLIRNIIRHQATLIKKEVFEKIKFNNVYKYAMDYDFFLRIWSLYGSPSIVKKHIVSFRLDGNNLSSNFYESLIDEFRVRINFRDYSKSHMTFIFDIIVVSLRFFKIKLYHSIKHTLFN